MLCYMNDVDFIPLLGLNAILIDVYIACSTTLENIVCVLDYRATCLNMMINFKNSNIILLTHADSLYSYMFKVKIFSSLWIYLGIKDENSFINNTVQLLHKNINSHYLLLQE